MNKVLQKLKSMVKSLEKENGPLNFCAIFLRDGSLERWDLLVSAPWLKSSEMRSYKIVSSKLQEALSDSELVQFSRVVILDEDDPAVLFLLDLETIKNGGYKELSAEVLSDKFRFTIKKAYLLRSQKFDGKS